MVWIQIAAASRRETAFMQIKYQTKWSPWPHNIHSNIITINTWRRVDGPGLRWSAPGGQIDGWCVHLLTSNKISQKQLASSFYSGLWQTVFMCWLPKHRVINYRLYSDLCSLIFMRRSQRYPVQRKAQRCWRRDKRAAFSQNHSCHEVKTRTLLTLVAFAI